MKTVQQLLELTKNPYYKMTNDEKAVLDDFLAKKRDAHTTSSQKKKEQTSEKDTPVRVRNIVEKTIPSVEEAGQ